MECGRQGRDVECSHQVGGVVGGGGVVVVVVIGDASIIGAWRVEGVR